MCKTIVESIVTYEAKVWETTDPVSYTHLDVYKRQTYGDEV